MSNKFRINWKMNDDNNTISWNRYLGKLRMKLDNDEILIQCSIGITASELVRALRHIAEDDHGSYCMYFNNDGAILKVTRFNDMVHIQEPGIAGMSVKIQLDEFYITILKFLKNFNMACEREGVFKNEILFLEWKKDLKHVEAICN